MPDPGHIAARVVIVAADGAERLVGRVDAGRADVAIVDALARLQLVARRQGGRVLLRDVPEELRQMLELVGLGEELGLEPRRQPEVGEQLGVEEVVQPGDPPV